MISNSLSLKRPDLAKQWHPTLNGSLTAKDVAYSSGKTYKWICELKHVWPDTPNIRSYQANNNCPICTNHRLLLGFNDLKTKFPKIANLAHGWDPTSVRFISGNNHEWKCSKGHIWEDTVREVCEKKGICPYCSNKKVLTGFNDLKTTHPNLAKEANGWNPREYMASYSKPLSWKCSKGLSR